MKNILITGANSYIGTSVDRWLKKYTNQYSLDTVDTTNDAWRQTSFNGYDVVLHVAGIAHVSADPKMKDLYYKVNRDLAIETASKAKLAGVKQFIFMSSIIVYGDSSYINKQRTICENTVPEPSNFYGKSKLQAEEGIKSLQNDDFDIVILRPPMVYGMGSKGNYSKLAGYAIKLPAFPDIDNQRSMIHIDNLCEFIRLMIDNEEHGIFFPQNAEYVKTAEMVKLIAEVHGKKIYLTKAFNPILQVIGNFVGLVNKAFGNLVYDKSLSIYKDHYQIRDLKQSIIITEAVIGQSSGF